MDQDDASRMKYSSQEMRQLLLHCLGAGIITRFSPSTHGPPLAEV